MTSPTALCSHLRVTNKPNSFVSKESVAPLLGGSWLGRGTRAGQRNMADKQRSRGPYEVPQFPEPDPAVFHWCCLFITREHHVSPNNPVVYHWWPPVSRPPCVWALERSPILSKIKIHWRESSLQYTLYLIIQNPAQSPGCFLGRVTHF